MSVTGNRGFTIVEVIVVVVIVSVLAGMIIPHLLGAAGSARLRESAGRLLATAQYARDFAAAHRCACRMTIDPSASRYVLEYQADPEHNPGEFSPVRNVLGREESLKDGLSFAKVWIERRYGPEISAEDPQLLNCITFEPTGRSDAAILQITDGRRTYSLLVAPSTGQARLLDGVINELEEDRLDLDG